MRRMLLAGLLALTLSVGGCATQIMQGYMGKSLQDVMLDYGPPANAFDMPNGARAFQWSINTAYTTPTVVSQTGSVQPVGNMALWSSHTQITGGQSYSGSCTYTMFAHWDAARSAWVFYDFHRPSMACA